MLTAANVSSILFTHDKEVFSRNLKNSFTCTKVEPLKLNSTQSFNGTLFISDSHVEAFGEKTDPTYSQGQYRVVAVAGPTLESRL